MADKKDKKKDIIAGYEGRVVKYSSELIKRGLDLAGKVEQKPFPFDEDAEKKFNLACELLFSDTTEAERICREIIRSNPDYHPARNLLIMTLQKQSKFEELLKVYQEYLTWIVKLTPHIQP